jgi:hypothetical protein
MDDLTASFFEAAEAFSALIDDPAVSDDVFPVF